MKLKTFTCQQQTQQMTTTTIMVWKQSKEYQSFNSMFKWSENEDFDECEEQKDICGVGGTCENLPGSYACLCSEGFFTDINGHCQGDEETNKWLKQTNRKPLDLDECDYLEIQTCHHNSLTCINTIGSYTCKCDDGFVLMKNECKG